MDPAETSVSRRVHARATCLLKINFRRHQQNLTYESAAFANSSSSSHAVRVRSPSESSSALGGTASTSWHNVLLPLQPRCSSVRNRSPVRKHQTCHHTRDLGVDFDHRGDLVDRKGRFGVQEQGQVGRIIYPFVPPPLPPRAAEPKKVRRLQNIAAKNKRGDASPKVIPSRGSSF